MHSELHSGLAGSDFLLLEIALCTTLSALTSIDTHASTSSSVVTHGPTDAPSSTNASLVSLVAGSWSLQWFCKIACSVSTNICAGIFNYMLVFMCASVVTMATAGSINTATISSTLHAFTFDCTKLLLLVVDPGYHQTNWCLANLLNALSHLVLWQCA